MDGTPIPQSDTPLDQKLAHLKDQTVVIRPFFLPMANSPWDEEAVNTFTQVDFDYAAVLGYGVNPEGKAYLKASTSCPPTRCWSASSPGRTGPTTCPWPPTTSTI